MEYKIIKDDLFNQKDCYYVHCVSRDYALGAGIAVEFDKRYDMRKKLIIKDSDDDAILIDNVFNLVTKQKYWQKPSMLTLRRALHELHLKVMMLGIKKLAMPKIGCGLDRLSWNAVQKEIKEIFSDLNIEIVVCYL